MLSRFSRQRIGLASRDEFIVRKNVVGQVPAAPEVPQEFVGCEQRSLPALSDDSGIEIDALDGAPGVYTADWAETPTGRDFTLAMERTHRELEARNAASPSLEWQKRPPKSPTIASPILSSQLCGIMGAIQLGALMTANTTSAATTAKAALACHRPTRSMMPP